MAPAWALLLAASAAEPRAIESIGIEEHLGAALPYDDVVFAPDGRRTTLAQVSSGVPVVLALVYYRCPALCGLVLNGVLRAVNAVGLELGRDFRAVALSIDPGETPELAAAKQRAYLERLRTKVDPE